MNHALLSRASPNVAFAVGENSGKAIIDDAFGVALIEDGKPHAVKLRQPVKRAQPQIPIRRLRDRQPDQYSLITQSRVDL